MLRGSDHEKWGKDPAVVGKQQATNFSERGDHEYLTIRGNEPSSVLLGVRSAVADSIELLLWSRWLEGTYRSTTGNRKKMNAYTRSMIGKITLKNQVGYMGKELVVMCMHLHFQVANKNKGFRKNNDDLWPWLADKIKQHGVQVLMGDFNMSLFKVVPELRSRGVPAAVAAWYPWRTKGNTPKTMADSCGIFMCVPCWTTECTYDHRILDDAVWWELDEHEENGGPGQSLQTYLPKGQDIRDKLIDTFPECPPAVAGKGQSKKGKTKDYETAKGKRKGKREGLEVREKS